MKVTLEPADDTPSQEVVKAASAVTTITDTNGRQIGIRTNLPALSNMRMLEAIGPENSKNDVYRGLAALAYHVVSLGGEKVAQPATKAEFEALIQRLDNHGLNAIGEYFATEAEKIEKQKIEASLKNA